MPRSLGILLVFTALTLFTCASKPNPVIPSTNPASLDRTDLELTYANGEAASSVRTSLALPDKGPHGSDLVWTSSDPTILSNEGKVTPPLDRSRPVTLSVEISSGNEKRQKKFALRIVRVAGKLPVGRTVTLDGMISPTEWPNGARLATSTADTFLQISWDADYLYFALQGPGLMRNDPDASNRWLVGYFGFETKPGPTENFLAKGQAFRGQAFTLPFEAAYCFKWRPSDNFFQSAQPVLLPPDNIWDWSFLVSPKAFEFNPLELTTREAVAGPDGIEFKISREKLGRPDTLLFTSLLLSENPDNPQYWGFVPATAATDGKGKSAPVVLTQALRLDLQQEPPNSASKNQPITTIKAKI